jgi:predicted O-methyltransferase YrrM
MSAESGVKATVNVVTAVEMTIPREMTPFVHVLFAIPTHLSTQERLSLFGCAAALPAGFVALEIGSYLGASTAFLAYAALTKNGMVHAVDTWGNDAMGHEGERDTWREFHANTQSFAAYITTHRGRSVDVAERVGRIPCDLLFIDGDHTRDAVIADLRKWLPSLKPGGVLAMHDFDHPDVKAAFDLVVGGERIAPDAQLVDGRLLICRPSGYVP